MRIPDTSDLARRLGTVLEDWIRDTDRAQLSFLEAHRLMDADRMGELLDLPAEKVRELAKRWERGDRETGIPATKLGREWRFDPESVLAVLRRRMGVASLFPDRRGAAALDLVSRREGA